MIFSLKDYQRSAVDKLKGRLLLYLAEDSKNEIVFKAPTGSGKTYMASSLIEETIEENAGNNCCIMWACPGKGELHKQSFDAVKTYLGGNPVCSLLESEFFGSRRFIKNKEIVFVNWEKLIQKDKETGQWVNNLMRDQEGYSFLNVIDETKRNGTKIILIIDESHIGASQKTRIREFIETIIVPNVVLEMSATPISDHIDVTIDPQDVINEGMIKKDIIVNEGISKEDRSLKDVDSELIVLQKGFDKRKQLKATYESIDSSVNPLVLIQIPNVDEGEAKKIVIKDFLREKGVTEENGKLKLWCDKSADFDKKRIRENNDHTEYLIFKTAVATGWDCPRAQILIKFREGKSETFEVQTIGRILRTAEAKSYDNDVLDSAYIFTNIKDFETKQDTYCPNRIKTEFSKMRAPYTKQNVWEKTQLSSFYRSRQGDYNSADSRYARCLMKSFMTYFELNDDDKNALQGSLKTRLESKGLMLGDAVADQIIEETKISSKVIDGSSVFSSDHTNVLMSENDIQAQYYALIRENLNGLAYVRSKSPVNSAIIDIFSVFYNVFPRATKIKSIQRIVVNNGSIFAQIVSEASSLFRKQLEDESGRKTENYDFIIDDARPYSVETHVEMTATKSLYQPFYVLKNRDDCPDNKLEASFLKYLDHNDAVEWFWENGTELMKINYGVPYNGGMNTFQPDFIVMFSNGEIGIFDTKPINYRVEDTTLKSNALHEYIEKMNVDRQDKPNIIGGIVIQEGTQFYVFTGGDYHDFSVSRDGWRNFNDVIDS